MGAVVVEEAAGDIAAVGGIAPGEDNIAVEEVAAVQGNTAEEEVVQDSTVEEEAVQDSIVAGEVPVVEEEADNIAVAVE